MNLFLDVFVVLCTTFSTALIVCKLRKNSARKETKKVDSYFRDTLLLLQALR